MDLATPPQVVLAAALKRYTKRQIASALEVDPRTVIRWADGAAMQAHYRLALLYLLSSAKQVPERPSTFTFVDLFAGIGGMRLAFESAKGRCIFSSEWDASCQKTYRENFGDEEIFGDIRELTQKERFDLIPPHDVLLAGFPC